MRMLKNLPTTEELALHDAQAISDRFHIPVIWCDHQATRRQRLHGANLPSRSKAYTSTHLNEILEHLAHEGYESGVFVCQTPSGKHLACQIDFMPLPYD